MTGCNTIQYELLLMRQCLTFWAAQLDCVILSGISKLCSLLLYCI